MVQISDGEEEVESDDDFVEIPPPPKKQKVNYDQMYHSRTSGLPS